MDWQVCYCTLTLCTCLKLNNSKHVKNFEIGPITLFYAWYMHLSYSGKGTCAGKFCYNGGFCDGSSSTFKCLCRIGFSGINCSESKLKMWKWLHVFKCVVFLKFVSKNIYYLRCRPWTRIRYWRAFLRAGYYILLQVARLQRFVFRVILIIIPTFFQKIISFYKKNCKDYLKLTSWFQK